jgi:predicted MFS family arabinose efflux permease
VTHLYVVAFAAAVLGLVSGVAQRAYVPTLIPRHLLVEGNGKLEVSRSVALVAGPGAAGVLVQLVGAPFAVAADALSFLVSALSLRAVRAPEPDPAPSAGRRAWAEVVDGLRFLGRHPVLRAIAGANGTYNFFSGIWGAVFVLYLTRDLRIPPAPLGFILGTAGLAALLGALLAPALTERAGLGRTIVASFALASAANLLVPLADGPLILVVGLVAASRFVYDFLVPVYNVSQSSLRQVVTPDHLLGRTSAAQSFISWGAIPIGALAGGALAELLGARTCLLIAAAGGMLGTVWLLLSPVAALRALPATPADPT